MVQVLLSGSTLALDRNRITLVKLLQREAGLSLATAKEYMERCVLGEQVVIDLPTAAAAEALASEAARLGAVAEVGDVRQPR